MKKMTALILVMFVMSFFAIASAHDYNCQNSIASIQALDRDDQPPEEPPDKHHKKHHEKAPAPEPEPAPAPTPGPEPVPEP